MHHSLHHTYIRKNGHGHTKSTRPSHGRVDPRHEDFSLRLSVLLGRVTQAPIIERPHAAALSAHAMSVP